MTSIKNMIKLVNILLTQIEIKLGGKLCVLKLKTNDQTEQKNPIKSSLFFPVPCGTLNCKLCVTFIRNNWTKRMEKNVLLMIVNNTLFEFFFGNTENTHFFYYQEVNRAEIKKECVAFQLHAIFYVLLILFLFLHHQSCQMASWYGI